MKHSPAQRPVKGSPALRPRGDAGRLLASLPSLPEPLARPVLVVVCGLPGAGKSYFARRLAARFPLLHLESDALRKALFPRPTYSADESARLFPAIHRLIDHLLQRRVPVLLDATNLVEAQRRPLYRIAERHGALPEGKGLALVWVEAPEAVVRERLARRSAGRQGPEDRSDADWAVYQRLRGTAEPIVRSHYVVDTSQDITPAVRRLARKLAEWAWGT
jgi:hypothetical protein